MATSNIEKATTFIKGIASGDPDLATRYVDPRRYIEHSPLVPEDYVAGLPKIGIALDIIRVFQDGPFVVAQAQGDVHGQNVFFNVFKLEDGLIVEHWSFSAKGAPPNKSGHTQADGPTEPKHFENTDKNKAIVRDYYETVHLAGQHDQARRWFSGDYCVRHEPGVADGVTAFLRDLKVLTLNRTIDEIKIFVGQGDFVFLVAKGTVEGDPCVYVDLYRVEDEKIVEHWGFPQQFPPSAEGKNTASWV